MHLKSATMIAVFLVDHVVRSASHDQGEKLVSFTERTQSFPLLADDHILGSSPSSPASFLHRSLVRKSDSFYFFALL